MWHSESFFFQETQHLHAKTHYLLGCSSRCRCHPSRRKVLDLIQSNHRATISSSHPISGLQAQRLQMKLYAQLQVQPSQRAVMAERWRFWCRRRRGLDKQLVAALQNLQVHLRLLNAKLRSFRAARGVSPSPPPCIARSFLVRDTDLHRSWQLTLYCLLVHKAVCFLSVHLRIMHYHTSKMLQK
jgi:hypothetical protein